ARTVRGQAMGNLPPKGGKAPIAEPTGDIRHFQRRKLQAGLPYVSQECFVTSPARFLLCTMVLMNSKRICKNNV
ncbi:hypothetical protein, partial [Parabacteroides sp. D26]|uniref:hypothetical protein n=1 Tax=Parabacteroides sp. D26 TaxID=658662 RepID=UPI0035681D9C